VRRAAVQKLQKSRGGRACRECVRERERKEEG
jgi:hypothetical protein